MQTIVLFLAAVSLALFGWAGLATLGEIIGEWWRQSASRPFAVAMAGPSLIGGERAPSRSKTGGGLPAGNGLPGDLVDGFAEEFTAVLTPLTKPWWQSRGVWGPVIAILSLVGGWFGLDLDAGTQAYLINQTVAAVTAAGVFVGAVIGIIGRLRATHVIR